MNGGLYVLPRNVRQKLADDWIRFARFALDREDILGGATHHADQIGLAMALQASQIPFSELPVAENFPTHLGRAAYRDVSPCEISAFHHHSNLDNHGLPSGVGVDWIDDPIANMRRKFAEARRGQFSNPIF